MHFVAGVPMQTWKCERKSTVSLKEISEIE